MSLGKGDIEIGCEGVDRQISKFLLNYFIENEKQKEGEFIKLLLSTHPYVLMNKKPQHPQNRINALSSLTPLNLLSSTNSLNTSRPNVIPPERSTQILTPLHEKPNPMISSDNPEFKSLSNPNILENKEMKNSFALNLNQEMISRANPLTQGPSQQLLNDMSNFSSERNASSDILNTGLNLFLYAFYLIF